MVTARAARLAAGLPSPPNKPIDAAANEKDWKARTYDRTWSTPDASLIVVVLPLIVVVLPLIVLSQRRNAEYQQQDNRQDHVLHQMSLQLCWMSMRRFVGYSIKKLFKRHIGLI
jgi:hypothetical protein